MKKEEIDKMKEAFAEEIKRRDKIIDELKKSNELLLKAALKKAESRIEED